MCARPAQSFALDKDYHWRSILQAKFLALRALHRGENARARFMLRGLRREVSTHFGKQV